MLKIEDKTYIKTYSLQLDFNMINSWIKILIIKIINNKIPPCTNNRHGQLKCCLN